MRIRDRGAGALPAGGMGMSYDIEKVTPRPWRVSGYCRDFCLYKKCPDTWVSSGKFDQGTGFSESDAAHIVHCVNHHCELFDFLVWVAEGDALMNPVALNHQARALLAKVKS